MYRYLIRSALLAILGLSSRAVAQSPETSFVPMEFLVGSCWQGTMPDGKATDRHCFAWVYDHRFIRDQHVVRTPDGKKAYEGETMYGYNPSTKAIEFRYWSVDGLVLDGSVIPHTGELEFPSRYATAKGYVELRAVWRRVDDDTYRAIQSERSGNAWRETMTVEYHRQK